LLAEQGMSLEDYRKEVKLQLQRTKLVNREVRSKVVITEADIKLTMKKTRRNTVAERVTTSGTCL